MDCNSPGSSVHGISQARILEWIVISSFRGSSWPRDWTGVSYVSCIGRRVLYHWVTRDALNARFHIGGGNCSCLGQTYRNLYFRPLFWKYVSYLRINSSSSIIWNYLDEPQENKLTKPCIFFFDSFIEIQITYHITHPVNCPFQWLFFSSIFRVVQPWVQSILEYLNQPQKKLCTC